MEKSAIVEMLRQLGRPTPSWRQVRDEFDRNKICCKNMPCRRACRRTPPRLVAACAKNDDV